MTRIKLPTVYRVYAGDNRSVEIEAGDVGKLLDALTQQYPDLKPHLFDNDGELLSFVNVFVNDDNIRDLDGNATELGERDEVFLVPAMAGG
ncbi:ubiquitin-like small modifier protein 1 [Stieleria marina]|uniref:Sulfur carrier protein CysO n=1 Tax=Stieleria marina TaxID=1930275 RepID=A0A517NMS9_9BACT|nr:Sulfur carrier protein CysO [Planctomycetes bacterium K23_9]